MPRSREELAEIQALVKDCADTVGERTPRRIGFLLVMFNRGGEAWTAFNSNVRERAVLIDALEDALKKIKAGLDAPLGALDKSN